MSPLTSTLTRETRDEVLDASTGSFLSQAFSYSPSWLGSDQPYLKYFGQYFHYFPLQAPRRKPFTNEILRPRLVFATGVRLGLARGFGGGRPAQRALLRRRQHDAARLRAERGRARSDSTACPPGGDAMLVLNNELRVPLVSIFDGVVFARHRQRLPQACQDFSLTDLRESAGVGLRVRTPWFLLRGDYGVRARSARRANARSRFYFSIGQAF